MKRVTREFVHSADTRETELAPEGIGSSAIMIGARLHAKHDLEAVENAAYVYDALYTCCDFKLVREKYKDELGRMDRKEQREFLRKKMLVETAS